MELENFANFTVCKALSYLSHGSFRWIWNYIIFWYKTKISLSCYAHCTHCYSFCKFIINGCSYFFPSSFPSYFSFRVRGGFFLLFIPVVTICMYVYSMNVHLVWSSFILDFRIDCVCMCVSCCSANTRITKKNKQPAIFHFAFCLYGRLWYDCVYVCRN